MASREKANKVARAFSDFLEEPSWCIIRELEEVDSETVAGMVEEQLTDDECDRLASQIEEDTRLAERALGGGIGSIYSAIEEGVGICLDDPDDNSE